MNAVQKQIQLTTQAFAHYQAGRLAEADAACAQILRQAPHQIDALNILAAVRATQGNGEEAVTLMTRALTAAPQFVDGYVTRAHYLQQLGRLGEALEDCTQALSLRPGLAAALMQQGAILTQLRDFASAFTVFEQVHQAQPALVMPLFRLGDIHLHLRQHAEALAYYDQAMALAPPSVELLHNRALALLGLGKFGEALVACDAALKTAPKLAALHYTRGRALQHLDRWPDALAAYNATLTLAHQHFDAHNNRATVLRLLGQPEKALMASEAALSLRPQSAEAYDNYAHALLALHRDDEAFAAFDQAVRLAPDMAAVENNRSNAFFTRGRYAEALAGFDRVIALAPKSGVAQSSRGLALQALGRQLEAKIAFDRAMELEPDSSFVQFNKASHRLLHGDFAQGFALYEARHEINRRDRRAFTQPLWLGAESIAGKTVLLHAEQGLGDTIQFCRYVPMVEALGAQVILEVPESLGTLMRSLPGDRTVIVRGEALPSFDLHCPLMSLPLAFGTTLETIPHAVPYLAASGDAKVRWEERLGKKMRPRIGLVWSGTASHKNDHNRSITLETLAPLLALDADFHALQKERRPQEVLSSVVFHGELLSDMAETAALAAAMDLIISVDTSVAHLAGALGKPTWILLPFVPDFRWLLERPDTPWYPTAKLLRQPAIGDWGSVITYLAARLEPVLS